MNTQKLEEILKKQLECYRREIVLVDKRIKFIEKNDIDNLNKIIIEERTLGDEIKNLENMRIKLFENTEYKKLTDLIESLENDELKMKFWDLKENLLAEINEIKAKNELCSKLIKISSGMIEKLMGELTGKKEVGYNKYRKKENISRNNLLNTKV